MKHFYLLLIVSVYSFGCGWVNGTTIDGHWREGRSTGPSYDSSTGLTYSFESTSTAVYQYLSNKFPEADQEDNVTQAVFKMLTGDHQKAIDILLHEEAKENRYDIAANLGTAYELSGDNILALQWIKESMDRNASSHYGTEWLHVRILETKLRLNEDKDYLKHHHVLSPEEFSLGGHTIKKALLYQLKERMLFVKPKDKIVADLLYTYAVMHAEAGGFLEYSIEALDLAGRYGYENPQELTSTQMKYQKVIDHVALMITLKWIGFTLLFFTFLFIAYKKKWFFLSKKAQDEYIKEVKSQDSAQATHNIQLNVGRWLLVVSAVLTVYVVMSTNNLVAGFFTLITGWVFAYYFISNAKVYEKDLSSKKQDPEDEKDNR